MKAVFVVESQPSDPAREDEYNKWYDEVHVPQVCAVPGVTGARRFRAAPGDAVAAPYLALYEIDADDPNTALAGIFAGVADGSIEMSDAIQLDPAPKTALYHLHSSS